MSARYVISPRIGDVEITRELRRGAGAAIEWREDSGLGYGALPERARNLTLDIAACRA